MTAVASVRTEQPERYLVQLCRHAGNLQHAPGRLHGHLAEPHDRPEVLHVEWSDTAGSLELTWGRCELTAGAGVLTLRVEAPDEESLRRVQELLTSDLVRFSSREPVTVEWDRPA